MQMLVLLVFPVLATAVIRSYYRNKEEQAARFAVHAEHATDPTIRWMRRTARVVAVAWAGLIALFMLVSGATRPGLIGILMNSPNALPGVGFLICVALACRWEALGGAVLLAEGLLVFPIFLSFDQPLSLIWPVMLSLGLPPLVAGLLFLGSWRKSRAMGMAEAAR